MTETPHNGKEHQTLSHVHETKEAVALVEETPPHPPREETPAYARAHHHLVFELDSPCLVCGVRHSTLGDAAANPYGARAIETHHYPIERSLMDAVDLGKIEKLWPDVHDRASLEQAVDSERNLIVLCDVCHRSPERGIHHLLVQDWAILPYLLAGYQVATTPKDADAVMQKDEQIIEAAAQ